MKAVVAAFNQEKALVGAFSVITDLRMQLFEALVPTLLRADAVGVDLSAEQLGAGVVVADHAARGARVPLHAVSGGSRGNRKVLISVIKILHPE